MPGAMLKLTCRVVLLMGTIACGLIAAAPAQARTVWLCGPGVTNDPCRTDLTTTAIDGAGGMTTASPLVAADAPIDCFYLYPPVSYRWTANADLRIDASLRAAASAQAARFSSTCKVYAPVYRQVTVATLMGGKAPLATVRRAYADVLSAWRDYLAHYNHGRGFVLIGHSQGGSMLTQLVREQIDGKAAVRRRLVSALILGANVTAPAGKVVGGDFKHVPACQSAEQTGCVVAYSAFNEKPYSIAYFGRLYSLFQPIKRYPGARVLCVNPAQLTGDQGWLEPFFPTTKFPGLIGKYINIVPRVPAPFATYPSLYRASCKSAGQFTWLQVDYEGAPGDRRPQLEQTMGLPWGLHIGDVNLALGNLVELVGRQAAAWKP